LHVEELSMTVMPADAPRSEDGQWWWDGTQWQPVAQNAGAGAGAGAAAPASAEAGAGAAEAGAGTAADASATGQTSSEAVGQLSEDGQWRWDGTQWQPAQGAAAGGTDIAVTIGQTSAEAHTTNDGTPALIVSYTITNTGTTAIESGRLQVGLYLLADGGSAEAAGYNLGEVLASIAPGAEHQGHSPLQADPGSWTVWVGITDTTSGQEIATSENMTAHVAGTVALAPSFDDTQTYALTVTITHVEHVQGALFRIHYDLQSDRDVPAGLNVSGKLEGAQANSGQLYDLTTGLTAGHAHPHYLTLEADTPSHITANIRVDPGGPSEAAASVEVDIAEDGTPTITG
jgi:hypothetical protein